LGKIDFGGESGPVELDEALKAKIQDIAKAEHLSLGSSGDAD